MKTSKWFTYENGLLLLLGFSFGIVFFDRNAVGVLSTFIVRDLDLTNTQLGMLSSGLALAWAFSAYLIGAWSDRKGTRKPFLLATIIVFSICSALSGLAGSFLFLLIARVVMGMAEGPFLPICLSIMNIESSPKRRGVNAGLMQTFFASLLGTTLAPIVLVALAELYSWRVAFFLTGIPGLVCALLIWKYVREPRADGSGQSKIPIEAAPVADAVSDAPEETHKGLGALKMLGEHNILICSLIACFMVAWYLIALTFLPIFLTQYRGFSTSEMAGLMAVTGLSTIFGGFLIPMLSDRIGRKPAMIIFCFFGVIAPLAALYFNGPIWMLGLFLFIGWSSSGAFPVFMGVIPGETVSLKYSATAMGLVVCVGELVGGFGAPWAAGWAADQSSLATPIIIVAICAVCASLLSFFLIETAPSKVGLQKMESA
jgi:MFS family permease